MRLLCVLSKIVPHVSKYILLFSDETTETENTKQVKKTFERSKTVPYEVDSTWEPDQDEEVEVSFVLF